MAKARISAGRLLAEGVVIVASILLAFALDAWWDVAQRNREVAEILTVLDAEFAKVEAELNLKMDRNRGAIASADTILLLLRSGDGRIPTGRLGNLFRTPSTNSTQGALSALITSGRLDLLPSQELQASVAGWSSVLEDLQEDETSANRFVWEELVPYFSRVPDFAASLYARQGIETGGVVTIPITPEMINMVEVRRFLATYIEQERDRLQINELVDLIRRDIRSHLN